MGNPTEESEQLKTIAILLGGGVAGCASWTVIYPLDFLKSRLQTQSDLSIPKYSGIIDCFRKSVKAEGYRFLFQGWTATFVRAFPVNSITFLVYEWSFNFFNSLSFL